MKSIFAFLTAFLPVISFAQIEFSCPDCSTTSYIVKDTDPGFNEIHQMLLNDPTWQEGKDDLESTLGSNHPFIIFAELVILAGYAADKISGGNKCLKSCYYCPEGEVPVLIGRPPCSEACPAQTCSSCPCN